MNAAEREELRALEKAATSGPWVWDEHRVPTLAGRAGDPDTYEYDADVLLAEHHGECGCRSACTLELTISPPDAALIAAARNHLPALLDAADRLEALEAGVRELAARLTARAEEPLDDALDRVTWRGANLAAARDAGALVDGRGQG